MRGRKPKPTAIKVLTGNPGKRHLNAREPRIPSVIPSAPTHLSQLAKIEWRRVIKILSQNGLITQIDRAALAGYCANYARWCELEKEINRSGMEWVITTGKGNLVQNPIIGMANKSMELMLKFAAEFGMTPSARSRVTAGEPLDRDDLAVALFNKVDARLKHGG